MPFSPTKTLFLTTLAGLILMLSPATASADPRGVGLGVAVGLAYSPTKLPGHRGAHRAGGRGFAWGFFVDIPLLKTFYISPAAMLYSVDVGNGSVAATDIDLNFKFIVPLGRLRLGAGVNVGITQLDQRYNSHFGILGYGAWSLVRNFDVFTTLQYKRLVREGPELDNLYLYGGGMFRF